MMVATLYRDGRDGRDGRDVSVLPGFYRVHSVHSHCSVSEVVLFLLHSS